MIEHIKKLFPNYEINNQYLEALNQLSKNKNIFIMGNAGVGKTVFIEICKKLFKNIIILAPTGLTACNINGQTIHSFFQFPLGIINPSDCKNYKDEKKLVIKNTDLIIIDEISMVRSDTFEMINFILQEIMENHIPFGGKQLLIIGDLFQLSPIVKDKDEKNYLKEVYKGIHFFETYAFEEGNFELIEFKKIYRQTNKEFLSILNKIRIGERDISIFNFLNGRVESLMEYEKRLKNKKYIYLCNINKLRDQMNDFMVNQLDGTLCIYHPKIEGKANIKNVPIEEALSLKKDTQVMLVQNDPEKRWVNGTLGKVYSLESEEILVEINNKIVKVLPVCWETYNYTYNSEKKEVIKEVIGKITQFPLIRAYALSTHKSQGQTYENVYFDPTKIFTTGQLYTALSRCMYPQTLSLKKRIKNSDIRVDKTVLNFYFKNFNKLKRRKKINEEKRYFENDFCEQNAKSFQSP